MIVGIVKESFPNEARVAMVPALVPQLEKAGIEVVIESGAGDAAGFLDDEYSAKGAKVVPGRAEVFQKADLIAQVRALGANPEQGKTDLEFIRDGQAIVGMCEPLTEHDANKALADKGVAFVNQLRHTRMDPLYNVIISNGGHFSDILAGLMRSNPICDNKS